MNGARPAKDPDEFQAVKFCRSVVTLLDLHSCHSLAMSVRGQRVELARTAVRAVTVDELVSMDRPVRVGHFRLPSAMRFVSEV